MLCLAVLIAACTACDSSHRAAHDPPVLVPWQRVGDISLGEPKRDVVADYGPLRGYFGHKPGPQSLYRLHKTNVALTFESGRVDAIGFLTPYYRTKTGFGVGSKIPLGPCVKTWTHRCGHRWHGFVWNEVYKEQVCGCWVKVGTGNRSLRPTTATFERRWIFIYVRHGRVTGFYFSRHYVD